MYVMLEFDCCLESSYSVDSAAATGAMSAINLKKWNQRIQQKTRQPLSCDLKVDHRSLRGPGLVTNLVDGW